MSQYGTNSMLKSITTQRVPSQNTVVGGRVSGHPEPEEKRPSD